MDAKKDREYTLDECYGLCSVVKDCAGFLHSSTNNRCSLARKGCRNSGEANWKYYSMDDCRFGNNLASLMIFCYQDANNITEPN